MWQSAALLIIVAVALFIFDMHRPSRTNSDKHRLVRLMVFPIFWSFKCFLNIVHIFIEYSYSLVRHLRALVDSMHGLPWVIHVYFFLLYVFFCLNKGVYYYWCACKDGTRCGIMYQNEVLAYAHRLKRISFSLCILNPLFACGFINELRDVLSDELTNLCLVLSQTKMRLYGIKATWQCLCRFIHKYVRRW